MKEITANKDGVKVYVGSEAAILADADGKVLHQRPSGTKPVMTICGSGATLKVGTDAEVAAEKVAADVKYVASLEAKPKSSRPGQGPRNEK